VNLRDVLPYRHMWANFYELAVTELVKSGQVQRDRLASEAASFATEMIDGYHRHAPPCDRVSRDDIEALLRDAGALTSGRALAADGHLATLVRDLAAVVRGCSGCNERKPKASEVAT
jgi:hypothetical protein